MALVLALLLTAAVAAQDTDPPVWDTTVGVQAAIGGRNWVTLYWNGATDAQSPPVTYNLYYSETSPAIEGTLMENIDARPGAEYQYQFDLDAELESDVIYYFTIRAVDSAPNPNEDDNTVEVWAVKDTIEPEVVARDPDDGETGVDPGATIFVELVDDGWGINVSTVRITVDGLSITPEFSGTPFDLVASVQPPGGLPEVDEIEVQVTARDRSVPPNNMDADFYSFFTGDVTPPGLREIGPAPDATNVPTNSSIGFVLEDTGAGLDLTSIDFAVDGVMIVENGEDETGGEVLFRGDDRAYRVLWQPSDPLPAGAQVDVSIDAADAYTVPNVMPTMSYSFQVGAGEDTDPPTWPGTVGAQQAKGTSQSSVVVRWNVAEDALSPPVHYRIYYSTVNPPWGGTIVDYVVPEPAVNYDLEYEISGLIPDETYYFGVRAVDNTSPGNMENNTSVVWALVHDTSPPYVTDLSPAPGQAGVPPEQAIFFRIRDDGDGVDISSIEMRVNGVQVVPSITPNEDYTSVAIYYAHLPFGQQEQVDVWVQAADLAAPPNVMSPFTYSYTTRDTDEPDLHDVLPQPYETGVALNSDIAMGIRDLLSGVDLTSVNILINDVYLVQNGEDQTGGQVTISGDASDYHFLYEPAAPFEPNTLYEFMVIATDLEEDPNLMVEAYNLTTGTESDQDPPYVDQLDPAPDSTAYRTTNVSFHVKDDFGGVNLSTLNVTLEGEAIVVGGEDQTGGQVTIRGQRRDIEINYDPPQPFADGQVVDVVIDAADFTSPGNAMTTYSYSFTVAADVNPPIGTNHYPPKNATDAFRNTSVHLDLIDGETGVDASTIVMTVAGAPVSPTVWEIDGGYHVYWPGDPDNPFDLGQEVFVTIQVDDLALNPNTFSDTYSFIVGQGFDVTDPTVAITAPQPGEIITDANTYLVQGTADDTESGVHKVQFQAGFSPFTWELAEGTTNWQLEWSLPPDGVYIVHARAKDNCRNLGDSSLTQIVVDNLPPETTITFPEDGGWVGAGTVTIEGICEDAGIGVQEVQVSLDQGATWEPAQGTSSWTFDWTPPGSGSYVIRARGLDEVGHLETPGAEVTTQVDLTFPSSEILDPPDGAYITTTEYRIAGTAEDTESGLQLVEVSVDDGATWFTAVGTESWYYDWSIPSEGEYVLWSRAQDLARNQETPTNPHTVVVDYTPPSSQIDQPAAGDYLRGETYTVQGTAQDATAGLSVVEISVDQGPWEPATALESWTYEWTLPEDGSHNLRSRATDLAGNVEQPGAGVDVIVDNTAPSSTIVDPPDGWATNESVPYTISGTAEDNLSGLAQVEISLDGGSTWEPVNGTDAWTYEWTIPETEGVYVLHSRATDVAGNVEPLGDGNTIYVDRTAPSSVITRPPDGGTVGGGVYRIEGTASDTISGVSLVEVSVDGGATWVTAEGTESWYYDWTVPESGTFNIRSRATDPAGNVEAPGPGVTVTVDDDLPSSQITQPADGALLSGATVTISGTASDPTSGIALVEVSLDGGATWQTATGGESWSYVWTLPDSGEFNIRSRATDEATNQEVPGPGINVTVDNLAPASSISNLEDGGKVGRGSFTILGTATDEGSGVDRVEISFDGGASWEVVDGATEWSFTWSFDEEEIVAITTRATDVAGNVETPADPMAVTIDLTPPRCWVGGWWDTRLTRDEGGYLTLVALCMDEDVQSLELTYLGTPTGVFLLDDGSQGDWTAGDRIYTFAVSVGPGLQPGLYPISVRATDDVGNWEEWPGLTVPPQAP
jgi:hypothetical protein